MRLFSKKREKWQADYKSLLASWTPDKCARCGRPGEGWTTLGGAQEPHHPYLRTCRWKMMVVIPLCGPRGCHEWVHAHPNEARREGWLIR